MSAVDLQSLLTSAISRYDGGELEAARQLCQKILLQDARETAALHLLGLIANDLGDPDTATSYLKQAVQIDASDPDVWNDLGNALQRGNRVPEAMQAFGEAVRLAPFFADAHSNFGFMLFRQGKFQESLPHFQRALEIDPTFTLAYNNLGSALMSLERLAEAVEVLQRAIHVAPHDTDAYINLGNALRRMEKQADAITVLEQGLRFTPDRAELWVNLGGCHKDLRDFPAAQLAYERAIRARTGYAEAHWNLSLIHLALGNFARGWEEFEWRRRVPGLAPDTARPSCPEWTGQELSGKSIVLIAEQGMGDTIQFIRYAEPLKQAGAHVTAAVPSRFQALLRSCPFLDAVVSLGDSSNCYDYFSFLLSLPRRFSSSLDSLPSRVPYLSAETVLVKRWRERLKTIPCFQVGISWQGNPQYAADRVRSMPLQCFEPLARIPGVSLISLQQGYGTEQLAEIRGKFSVVELGHEVDQATGAFMDTAAILSHLDLVIACDTALVHLAGAMGIPVWVPTSYVPDWRWLLDRSDSPWYPTVRLFRQRRRLEWTEVFLELAEALSRLAARREPARNCD